MEELKGVIPRNQDIDWFVKIQEKLLMTPGHRIEVKTSLLSD